MGLAWQQGPIAPSATGRFLVPDPLPGRLLYAEPLRRRMRVRFGGAWIADSEDVVLLHEPVATTMCSAVWRTPSTSTTPVSASRPVPRSRSMPRSASHRC